MTAPAFHLHHTAGALRLALVGAGGMGRAWADVINGNPEVQLVSWVDTAPGQSAKAVSDAGLRGVLAARSLREALDQVGADAVVDVTIPEAHREVTLEALSRGLPVLGEKPLATTMAHAREMVAAAEQAGQLFMVSQSRRYAPGIPHFKALVDRLLPLGILTSGFWLAPRFGGFRDDMADPLLIDMAIHTFDAARMISHAEPVSVRCETFNPPWSWYAGDACAVATFEMTGGLRYIYSGGWCVSGAATSWNATWRATGAAGTALWDGEGVVSIDIPDAEQAQTVLAAAPATPPSGLSAALAEFIDALRTGRTPMGECHDNLVSLAMVHAAVTSAGTDSRVTIADILSG